MLNTLIKNNNKSVKDLDTLFENVYLLPNWEKINQLSLQEKKWFSTKTYNVDIYRKFSIRNGLEKYSIKTNNETSLASMDLKIYKDNVYIIDIDFTSSALFEKLVLNLLQISAEKALYNTTDKEVKINLSMPLLKRGKMKQILINSDFEMQENQSKYEKEMFGETYSLNVENSIFWQKKIKQSPILINK